jgi:leucyl-tRNA synthetase
MGVPAHDQRDFEFAKECDLEVKRVVSEKKAEGGKLKEAYEGEGFLVNSGEYDTMPSAKARKKMIADFSFAQRQVTYHLRDWLISRQRYWGPPIPMIHCEVCEKKGKGERDDLPGWYSVSEKDLPIKLPEIKDFKPKGKGHTPLSNAPDSWKKVECPHCGNEAERELEVSDTFLDSSWYFLGYPHMRGGEWVGDPFDNEILKKWLPVNAYIGGAEHAVLHLLYARFVTMALHDMGYLDFEEPFPFLFTHGLLISEGAKMSKSRGNVVVPDTYIEKFGADTLRSYLMFLGPYDKGGDFRDTGIEGMDRFLKRVWRLYENKDIALVEEGIADEILIKMHQTIKKVTKDIERLSYNTALARIMEYVNLLRDVAEGEGVKAVGEKNVRCAEWDDGLRVLALLLAPFAPHMMEEIWVEVLSQRFSIHASAWPKFNPELTREEEVVVSIQVNGKLRGTVRMDRDDASYKETVVVEAKKDEKVAKWLENVEDTIFVPGKVINFVTK